MKKKYVLSKQLLKVGTAIGAKMNIALKEANETKYWLMLLKDTGYLHCQLTTVN